MSSGRSNVGTWRLFCNAEKTLFEDYAREIAAIGSPFDGERAPDGTLLPAVLYYQRDRSQQFDPVYQEPTGDTIWRGPYRMPATLEWADDLGNYDQEVDDEGAENIYRAEMVIAVDVWAQYVQEAHDPAFTAPQEGDIVCFYKDTSECYSVNKVSRTGYTLTTDHHVEWKLELLAKRSFNPDRLLSPKLRYREED